MEKKILIVPDVHGRKFWEVVKNTPDVHIVFLGDYLDPYTGIEGITPEEAIENFKEILKFANENKGLVTLLYGNHDSYAFNSDICECRHDWDNHDEIVKLFEDNSQLFQMAYDLTVNDKHFLLTHAGVNPFWITYHSDVFGDNFSFTAEELNNVSKETLNNILGDVSSYRGGWNQASSMVWSDIHEHVSDIAKLNEKITLKCNIPENLTQVFGHTWIQKPINFNCKRYMIYCLDVQQVFYIDENGDIRYLNDDKKIEQTTL